MKQKKVLFSSPVQPIGGVSPDIYSWDKSTNGIRLILGFINHPGLKCLGANLPIDILEYPTWADFRAALDPVPDILGISFYINETEQALAMARHARHQGVKEIWAGNFGAYSPEIESAFDKVFNGWAESTVSQALGLPMISNEHLIHPEIYSIFGANFFPRMLFSGTLFTSRGCPYTCNFCQTPGFYGPAKALPLEEIERIVRVYKQRGVVGINILDENFGTFPKHAKEVVKIIHSHDLRWIALTRVDTLKKNFDFWLEHGMFGAHLGIESLNDGSLSGAEKRTEQLQNLEILKLLSRNNMFVQIFYILGFEEDTEESIKRDINLLASLDFDVAQIQVLTPYPRTEQRKNIEDKYGINEFDLSKYNSRNLVWNHPHISREQMKQLQFWSNKRILTPSRTLRTISKIALHYGRKDINFKGIKQLASQFHGNGAELHQQFRQQLLAARQWSKVGWYAHEESKPSSYPFAEFAAVPESSFSNTGL